ncbi:AAA family ATPase [Pseudomonas sp. PDM13]|uniref:AAA family ATPase n=1 Tax=Pseudomonas sp. PDM13 TaxID=2769255 RepID=UPI0021DF4D5D|nr:AAA family ATPase [Pseudomonas sp. PDM13]MCU9951508.1 AAA family ATPase [Pseudomonas sp. PDM13]
MITEMLINSVASYKSPSSISPTNRTCLFYGLNGAGKSTISSFLYNQADPRYTQCRIKQTQDCDLLVYNQDFLSEYFHEEDNLKGIFTLSKENKSALQGIELESKELEKLNSAQFQRKNEEADLNKQKEQARERASSTIWEIKTKYSGGDRVLEFCLDGLKRTELLFKHLLTIPLPSSAPSYSVDDLKRESSLTQGENSSPILPLRRIDAPWLAIEKNPLFEKIITGSQEGSVAQFISNLGNSDWVKAGLKYIPTNIAHETCECPFCQSPTITHNLSESIRNVFDEAYEADLLELERLKLDYSNLTQGLSLGNISTFPFTNKDLENSWAATAEALKSIFRENTLLIENKLKNPSIPLSLKSSITATDTANQILTEINKLIENHNYKINNKKSTAEEIKRKFWILMRWEFNQTISAYEATTTELEKTSGTVNAKSLEAEEKITEKKLKIAKLREQTVNIEEAINNINRTLVEIGIDGFSVIKHSENLYRIARTNIASNAFHSLSEGEKTVISFLYFIELCNGQRSADAIPKNKIIVIDDPISSLSHLYVFNIGQLIKRHFIENDKFEQIFILTHSLYFFYELTFTGKDKRDQYQHLFRIVKNADGSKIVPMRYEEIQNDYQSYWSIVKDTSAPPALIANCMRNIVEYFFNFVQKTDFNNVFQKPVLSSDRFKTFYRYMNRESHSLGQNIFDIKEFDYQIFKDGLKEIFQDCGYIDHYNAMMK